MKVLAIADKYDDPVVRRGLRLLDYDVVEYPSLDAIDLNSLQQDEVYGFLPNIYVKDLQIFKPSEATKCRDVIWPHQPKHLGTMKPDIPIPRIIIYTHNRPLYFTLTMNSILYSIGDCPEVPVTIVLNDPTPETLEAAQHYQDRYDQVDILLSKENAACGGMTIGLKWHEPEIAIGAEDDFILPPVARQLYPLWPYQFAAKVINGIDRVGWNVELENLEYNAMLDWNPCNTETRLGWHTYEIGTRQLRPVLMCQLNAYKTSFWRECYVPEFKSAFDSSLNAKSKVIACPFLRGYHIGWNREQDGYWSKEKRDQALTSIPDECHVKSLKTGEERIVSLDAEARQ